MDFFVSFRNTNSGQSYNKIYANWDLLILIPLTPMWYLRADLTNSN